MNRFIVVSVLLAAVVLVVVAAESNVDAADTQVTDEDNVGAVNSESTEVEEGRIRKHHLYGGLRKTILSYSCLRMISDHLYLLLQLGLVVLGASIRWPFCTRLR